MRTFTQEEKDWILTTLEQTAHDNYIVGALVKEAKKATERGRRVANRLKAAKLVELGIEHMRDVTRDKPIRFILFEREDTHVITLDTLYGKYTVTICERD
jgi:hypothetical protein